MGCPVLSMYDFHLCELCLVRCNADGETGAWVEVELLLRLYLIHQHKFDPSAGD